MVFPIASFGKNNVTAAAFQKEVLRGLPSEKSSPQPCPEPATWEAVGAGEETLRNRLLVRETSRLQLCTCCVCAGLGLALPFVTDFVVLLSQACRVLHN